MEKERYEEYKHVSVFRTWVIVIVFSALILTWGMLFDMLIPERPREWDFGVLPDAPGQSLYSTHEPALLAGRPLQSAPLPEATPLGRMP